MAQFFPSTFSRQYSSNGRQLGTMWSGVDHGEEGCWTTPNFSTFRQTSSATANWLDEKRWGRGQVEAQRSEFNPKPHGSGPICPHCFQRPITQKVLKFKKSVKIPNPRKTSAESKSWVMYPSKNVVLCLFLAPEQANAWKMGNNSVCYLSRLPHFCPHPGGGVGWPWGVGRKPLNRVKIRSRPKCGRLFADWRPHRPLINFCPKQKM